MTVYLRILISIISFGSRNRCCGLVLWSRDEAVVEEIGVQLQGREGNVLRKVPIINEIDWLGEENCQHVHIHL